MQRDDFLARWSARRNEWARLGVHVDGAKVCDEVLADFQAVTTFEDEAVLDLEEASARSGYSKDHLRRLVRLGRLRAHKVGRGLFFRTGDLPKKPTVVDALPVKALASPM